MLIFLFILNSLTFACHHQYLFTAVTLLSSFVIRRFYLGSPAALKVFPDEPLDALVVMTTLTSPRCWSGLDGFVVKWMTLGMISKYSKCVNPVNHTLYTWENIVDVVWISEVNNELMSLSLYVGLSWIYIIIVTVIHSFTNRDTLVTCH